MSNEIIRTEGLGFVYDDDDSVKREAIPALDGVSISIARGEYVAVLGHNGSGKSTFAKLLNLILTPTVGKIYIDGRDVTAENFTEDDVFELIHTRIGKHKRRVILDNHWRTWNDLVLLACKKV